MAKITSYSRSGNVLGLVQAAAPVREPKVDSLGWLNIGYTVEVAREDGSIESKFVSIPRGVDLDAQKSFVVNSKNPEFAAFRQSQNDLLTQLRSKFDTMEWGEECLIDLQVQLRKVNKVQSEVTQPGQANPYSKRIF